eukprot:5472512-Amphidinium_carterae.1
MILKLQPWNDAVAYLSCGNIAKSTVVCVKQLSWLDGHNVTHKLKALRLVQMLLRGWRRGDFCTKRSWSGNRRDWRRQCH